MCREHINQLLSLSHSYSYVKKGIVSLGIGVEINCFSVCLVKIWHEIKCSVINNSTWLKFWSNDDGYVPQPNLSVQWNKFAVTIKIKEVFQPATVFFSHANYIIIFKFQVNFVCIMRFQLCRWESEICLKMSIIFELCTHTNCSSDSIKNVAYFHFFKLDKKLNRRSFFYCGWNINSKNGECKDT